MDSNSLSAHELYSEVVCDVVVDFPTAFTFVVYVWDIESESDDLFVWHFLLPSYI